MKKTNTKKALGLSLLSLLLCVTMLVGTTAAWFTDTASTSVNKIEAGTLNIDFMMNEGVVDEETGEVDYPDGNWTVVPTTPLNFVKAKLNYDGEETLWEPGATYRLPALKLVNNGNLALKFNLLITGVVDGTTEALGNDNGKNDLVLATVLDVWVNGQPLCHKGTTTPITLAELMTDPDGAAHGVLLPKTAPVTDETADRYIRVGETEEYVIALHMQEEAGNEYQGMALSGMTFTAYATQYTYEYDSEDNQYDEGAEIVFAANQTEMEEAIQNATAPVTVNLPAGTYTMPTKHMKDKDVTFMGSKDTVIDLQNVATGQDTSGAEITFDGVTVEFGTVDYMGLQHTDKVVYKNATITGKQFLYAPVVEFVNCTFENQDDYCVWTYGATDVTFTDCTFYTGGKAVLVYNEQTTSNFVADITFSNCTFIDDNSLNTAKAAVETGTTAINTEGSNKYNLTFNNCTTYGFVANNGDTEDRKNGGVNTNDTTSPLWGNKNGMNKDHLIVVNNGETKGVVVADQDDLSNAIADASANEPVVVALSAGEYVVPNISMNGKEITFTGTEATTLDMQNFGHNNQIASNASVTFEGVTVKWATHNTGYQGLAHAEKVAYTNCTIIGTQFMYSSADFVNCTFVTPEGCDGYNVYGRGAGTLTFTNCTFNTAGRAIMLYQDQTTNVTVVLDKCVFNDNGVYTSPKAVVETGDGEYETSTFNIVITDCVANGFEINNSTSALWGNKDNMPADRLNVTIDGVEVY